MEILAVEPGSLAAEAGLSPGDRILAVNGRRVRDFLDLHLWLGEEILDLTVQRKGAGGSPAAVRIRREYGRTLGLTFPEPRMRHCANDCPFCFVDQLPPGLRKSLYYRDDDYRFSFLYGHFVTLTNIREDEFDRIVEQNLSPLYVSVHALDPEVRGRMLRSKRAGEIRRRLDQLVRGGITLHTQVVLVPGWNDGAVLEDTILGLAEYFPGVRSVAVVPVGLTGYRNGLTSLRLFRRDEARRVVEQVRRLGRGMRRRLGREFCYPADEFLVLAGKPIPPVSYYGDFAQRENGVGLVRSTLSYLERARPRGEELRREGIRRVRILTGESFGTILAEELPRWQERVGEVELTMTVARNRLLGSSVTVAGLLPGRDLVEAARPVTRPGDLVLVPDEAVNPDGLFLDDATLPEVEKALETRVAAGWQPLWDGGNDGEDRQG